MNDTIRVFGFMGPLGLHVLGNCDESCRYYSFSHTNEELRQSEPSGPRPKPTKTIPSDHIRIYEDSGIVEINGICATITCYNIIVPGKVMLVEFVDGTKEKMVLKKGDIFDVDTGLRIAIAKHVGRKYYNAAGIENLAIRLSYLKCIDKMIHKAHVENRARQKKLDADLRQKEIQEEARARRKAKKSGIKITKRPHKKIDPTKSTAITKNSR